MDYVIERTHIIDHEKFLDAGPHARDLWEWGMKYTGKFELDGAIPMSAVLASPWGYGGKKNIKAAAKLVEVGLWERTDKGFRVLQWVEQGNKTRAELDAVREGWRKKKAKQRSSEPPSPIECPQGTDQGTTEGTPSGVLNSYSYSPSRSDLGKGEPEREPASVVQRTADPQAPPPAWFDGVLATVRDTYSVELAKAQAWVRYAAHRASKSQREGRPYPPSREDALHWLSTVMVKEAADDRAKARDRADRDAAFAKERQQQRDAIAAPQPYHKVSKPPSPAPTERRMTDEEREEGLRRITDGLFAVGKTGS